MVTDNIRAAYPKFRQSEQKAAEYMLGHMDDMENMTLAKMVDTAGVSQPTVLRMLRRSGYDGFREVKIAVLKDRIRENGIWDDANDQVLGMPFHKGEKIEDIPGRIVVNTIELLNDSLKSISAKALEKTVRHRQSWQGWYIFCGGFQFGCNRSADKTYVFGNLM